MKAEEKKNRDYQRVIAAPYLQARTTIENDINAFYGRFASREGITRQEAQDRADMMELRAFSRRVQKYVEEKDMSPEANALLKDYNLKGRVSREELLQYRVDLALHELGVEEERLIGEQLDRRFDRSLEFETSIWAMSVPEVDTLKAMSEAITNMPFHDATWSDRIWDRQSKLRDTMEKNIHRVIMQGKNSTVLISDLRTMFKVSEYEAKRLLVTETARVQTETQRQLMLYNDYEKYIYLTESEPCDLCRDLEDKVFDVKDMVPTENAPPMHPNCKCATSPYVEEDIPTVEEQATEEEQATSVKPFDFMAIEDGMTDEEMVNVFRTVNKRATDVMNEYKELTGVDVLELYRERKFTDMWNPYDDERAKFVKFAMEKVGYDGLPYRISDTSGYEELYRGVRDLPDGSITKEAFEKRFRDGEMDISGSQTSFYGRGVYFGTEEGTAELYAGEEGSVIKAYMKSDEVNILSEELMKKSNDRLLEAMKKDKELAKELEAYEFISAKFNMRDSYRDLYAMFHGYDVLENEGNYAIFNRAKVGVKE